MNKILLFFILLICNRLWFSQGKGTGSSHRTLLYGNAILLRHQNSDTVRKIINVMPFNMEMKTVVQRCSMKFTSTSDMVRYFQVPHM
jgi:hypothetical protein